MKSKRILSAIISAGLILSTEAVAVLPALGTVAVAANVEVFAESDYAYTKTADNTVIITAYNGSDSVVTVPSKLGGLTVAEIGSEAFAFSDVAEVTIPNTVTKIQSGAFMGSDSLAKVTLPNALTELGEDAFQQCTALTSITLPSSLKKIEKNTFVSCSALTSIKIPTGVASIGDMAFNGCSKLASVEIAGTVTSIGASAFKGCKALTSVTVPDSVETIGASTFENCSSLSSVKLSGSLASVPQAAFYKCAKLAEITIPDSVVSIGDNAFGECTALKTADISENVASIGKNAFESCTSLETIVIPDGVETLGELMFSDCTKLKSVTLPDTLTFVGAELFRNCSSFTDIYFYGSEEEWVALCAKVALDNHLPTNCVVHYNHVPEGDENAYKTISGFAADDIAADKLTLTWRRNNAADGYIIEQYKGSTWSQIEKIDDINTLTLDVSKLSPSTSYQFRICTYKVINSKENKGEYLELTAKTLPDKISGLKVSGTTPASATISWDKNSSAKGYMVEQYIDDNWKLVEKIESNATVTYKFSGLTAETAYKFRVCAYDVIDSEEKCGEYAEITATTAAPSTLKPVAGLKVTASTTDSVTIAWTKSSDAQGYIVEQFINNKWTRLTKLEGSDKVSYKLTKLFAGTKSSIRVKSYIIEDGKAIYSACGYIAAISNPTPVDGLKVSKATNNSVTISWNKNTTAMGYIVEQFIDGEWKRLTKIENNANVSYTIGKLTPGTRVSLRVKTYQAASGKAAYGESKLIPVMTLNGVSDLKIGGSASTALRLNWTKDSYADGYIVEMYDAAAKKWVRKAKIEDNSTTCRIAKLAAGTEYSFRVKSYKMLSKGTAAYSDYQEVKGVTNPSAVAKVEVSKAGSDSITLKWTKNTSADGYVIEQLKNGKWVRAATIAGSQYTSKTIKELSSATSYQFRICTYKKAEPKNLFSSYVTVTGKTT